MIVKSDSLIQNPFVSIVIPNYNRVNTLSEAIDSILNQKCNFDFEIVIGDDFSTDNVREILLEYQKKILKLLLYFFKNKI
ncbi:MAG: glycosyltransferase family 2 protein [Paludibacter sp.]